MATATETLRAIEARAERAIVQELRLMVQEIVGLRTQFALDDCAHADALLLKLCRLERDQVVATASTLDVARHLMPALRLDLTMPSQPAYKVSFYDREYGDLTDVVTTDTFDAGVQLVRDRLPQDADYEVDASWTHGLGDMEVRTPHGTVVAHVEAVNGGDVTVQPRVIVACSALQVGDVAPLDHLFDPMPQAA
ncbi:MAG: hypothetical protein HYX43_06835 [Burkholderiales bacterium]|nr:hypothetical protein [Burkholderiales bacterium]